MACHGDPTFEAPVSQSGGLKCYRDGTHRTRHPQDTLALVAPALAQVGITRVANVTGLDRVGIPVMMVVRPNARSVSVSQGKGTSPAAAEASGVMEAIEAHVAEVTEVTSAWAPFGAPPDGARAIDYGHLPRQRGAGQRPDGKIGWCKGVDMLTDERLWAPDEVVHLDYTLPLRTGHGWLFASSNGLASGNTVDEALVHGICEVIERDCRTRWAMTPEARIGTRIDPASIGDETIGDLLERLESAGMEYGIWDITGPTGVPAFECAIREVASVVRLSARVDCGSGCHPCREVALSRAITEAAQMRLTYLVGARDDQGHAHYGPPPITGGGLSTRRLAGGKDFGGVPTFLADSPSADLGFLKCRLIDSGIESVFSFRFPADHLPGIDAGAISIVRVIVPGLAGPIEANNAHLFGPDRIR